jgi:membrane protease subunit (stomatin/prohibitin family)
VNVKEILNNKIGWGKIPFRHYDPEFDRSIVVQVQGFGIYTFKITDPLMFYKNVAGNITDAYLKETLLSTMKAEVMSALNPALGRIAQTKIPYDELIMYPQQLGNYIDEHVSPKWGNSRGIHVVSFAVESITVDEESAKKIAQLQETAIHTDAGMAAARLATAQANAMENAANNQGGAMTGFMGMGMAQGMGGANAADLFKVANDNKAQAQAQQPQQAPAAANTADSWTCSCGVANTGRFCAECGGKKPEPVATAGGWTCSCGVANTGKFCAECGGKKPEEAAGWTCSCGMINTGKFCGECGKQQGPSGCPKCGWKPDGTAPKFCPECGEKL